MIYPTNDFNRVRKIPSSTKNISDVVVDYFVSKSVTAGGSVDQGTALALRHHIDSVKAQREAVKAARHDKLRRKAYAARKANAVRRNVAMGKA